MRNDVLAASQSRDHTTGLDLVHVPGSQIHPRRAGWSRDYRGLGPGPAGMGDETKIYQDKIVEGCC